MARDIEQEAIENVAIILKYRLRNIVESGFEGWQGSIKLINGFEFEVAIDITKRPGQNCEQNGERLGKCKST